MNKRDCFNSRVRAQGQSRADKVVSWRGSSITQDNRQYNHGDMMRASGDMESIWNTIPNVSSKPFCSSRYGDHLVKNYDTNNFESIRFAPQATNQNYNENNYWFEGSNFQRKQGAANYSLFKNSVTNTPQLLPLRDITSTSNIRFEQQLNQRLSCIDQGQDSSENPFGFISHDNNENSSSYKNHSMTPKSSLSWSQVVAEVKDETEKISNESQPKESTPSSEGTDNEIYSVNTLQVSTNAPRNTAKYISGSLLFTNGDNNRTFSESPVSRPYMVIKVQNVPWSSSSEDLNSIIRKSLCYDVPSARELPHNVHIIMDRHTGKTCGIAFIEVKVKNIGNVINDQEICNQLSRLPLQGRRLKFVVSGYDELRQKLFHTWEGNFINGIAVPSNIEENNLITVTNDNSHHDTSGNRDYYIGQRDLQSVLQISRNYKAFYNRKCPERSFEYIMSIAMNIPWLQLRAVSTFQRDIIYECYKLATAIKDSLRNHISKPLHSFNNNLLSRFIRTAILCDGFTVRQKINILKTAHQVCPDDLVKYITIEDEEAISIKFIHQA